MVKQVVHLKSRLQQAWEASRAYARLPGRDRPWWLWALIGAAVLTIFMIFGILIMLNFGRVIYVLLLAWVAAQTLLFLLMAYLVPPPESIISSQHPRSAPGSILSHHIFGFPAWG